METDVRGEQMIQALSFEVEAIPQEDTIHVRGPANMTPITVKIRVRKREDGGVQKGLISVPKFGPINSEHERIRLVSSDQTIMSFNMLMEADLERKPLRKPRKRFFVPMSDTSGGCLGTQADDDEGPYVPATIGIRDSKSETGMVNTKLKLAANTGDDYDTYVMARKDKTFFGSKCKPGGCLDPPFNEEKYSYLPTPLKSALRTPNENIVIVENPDNKQMEMQSPILSKTVPRKKGKSSDTSSIKTSDLDDNSVLSLYKVDATKSTLDENGSDHIITYPPELTSSEQRIEDERKRHSRSSSASKSRKSFNEINTPYFIPPKKETKISSSRENSSDKNVNLLRKGVTKERVQESIDHDNMKQDNMKQDKVIAAAIGVPLILGAAGCIEPLSKLRNTENDEVETNVTKKAINEPEFEETMPNKQGQDEQSENLKEVNSTHPPRAAMRGRPQMPKILNVDNSMEIDNATNEPAQDVMTNYNKTDYLKSDHLIDDIAFNTIGKEKKETENDILDPSSDSKVPIDTFSDVDSVSARNHDNTSPNNQQEQSGRRNLTDKPYESTIKDKQSKKDNDNYPIPDTNVLKSSAPNYRKPSSLVGKDKYTMDVEPGDRQNMTDEMVPNKLAPEVNSISDSKLRPKRSSKEKEIPQRTSTTNSLASYNKRQSSLTRQEKSRKYVETGGFDDGKKPKQNRPSLVANATGSNSFGNDGQFYSGSKQSSYVEQGKITEIYDSGNPDEGMERKIIPHVRNTLDPNIKVESEVQKPEIIKQSLEHSQSHEKKHSEDTDANDAIQNVEEFNNISLENTVTQKASREILSAVSLRKVQQYAASNQSVPEDEISQQTNETKNLEGNNVKKEQHKDASRDKSKETDGHEISDVEKDPHPVNKELIDSSHEFTKKTVRVSSESLLKGTLEDFLDSPEALADNQENKSQNIINTSGQKEIDKNTQKNISANENVFETKDSTKLQLGITSNDFKSKDTILISPETEQIYSEEAAVKSTPKETIVDGNAVDKDKKLYAAHEHGTLDAEKDDFPDTTTDAHAITKETGSNESVRNFETLPKMVNIEKELTVSEKSDETAPTESHIFKKTPMMSKKVTPEEQQRVISSNEEGLVVKQKSSQVKDSIMLDLAFTSYFNDNDEKVVKTLQSSVDTQAMQNVVIVKTAVKSDSKDLRIPIDYDNYMSIKIKKARKESDRNKSESDPTSLEHLVRESGSFHYEAGAHASAVKFETDVKDKGIAEDSWPNKGVEDNILQDTLTSIYERELVPLQNTIKCLQADIDVLAEQQIKFRDTVQGVRMLKPARLVHSNKRCGCLKKINN